MRFHDNPRLRSTHASSPRSFGAYHSALLIEFLGVLPKIPDISVSVLREIVKCILPQETSLKNSVVNYPTGHSVDYQGSVCNRELISLLKAFPFSSVNKSDAWWQREKRIVNCNREIRGINVTRCYIKSIFGQTAAGGSAVFIDANSKLGTLTSSKRFKEEIQPMDKASEALFALKPVAFRYKKEIDPAGISQFGLVAEDVEKVNRDLVVRDREGKPYSVRYDQVNAMLLNEFLKEHRKNEQQEKTIVELKSGISALAATVKEQQAQIQKVSAQLEASKTAPQIVLNNQ